MSVRFAVAAALLSTAYAAHADTVFNVNATLQSGGNVSGTVTLDSASDAFSAMNVTALSNGTTYSFTTIGLQQNDSGDYLLFSGYSPDGYSLAELSLFLPNPSLAGFNGSPLCVVSSPCGDFHDVTDLSTLNGDEINPVITNDFATAGAITPMSASTPEPGSLLLLGTGVLGAAGGAKGRLRGRTRRS